LALIDAATVQVLTKVYPFYQGVPKVIGKIGVPDRPLPIFVDPHILLAVNKKR
jgi:hypothetical protein